MRNSRRYLPMSLVLQGLLLLSCLAANPFMQDIRRIHQGMSQEQLEALMSKYNSPSPTDAGIPRPPEPINLLGEVNPKDIVYPLDDGKKEVTEKRIYRHQRRGQWEYIFITLNNGRVESMNYLR